MQSMFHDLGHNPAVKCSQSIRRFISPVSELGSPIIRREQAMIGSFFRHFPEALRSRLLLDSSAQESVHVL